MSSKKRFVEPENEHIVHFYPVDEELISSLTEYCLNGLTKGDTCIVIASPQCLVALNAALRAKDVNVAAAIKDGQYIMLDCDDTVARFTKNGMPDRDLFKRVIGQLLSLALGRGKPIRAYSEMVMKLIEDGNGNGVLKLEEFWNEILEEHPIALYCAYPSGTQRADGVPRRSIRIVSSTYPQAV